MPNRFSHVIAAVAVILPTALKTSLTDCPGVICEGHSNDQLS